MLKCFKETLAVKFPALNQLNDDWWKRLGAALNAYASSGKVDETLLEKTNTTTKLTLGLTGPIKCEPLNINFVHKLFN